MFDLVDITVTSRSDFAWQDANRSEVVLWKALSEDAIFAPRWHRVKAHSNGCWFLQMAPSNRAGHILLGSGLSRVYAHRHAFEVAYGPLAPGVVVRHRCDDPACINPTHLTAGTQRHNIHDCIGRERRNAFGRQRVQLSDVLAIRRRFAAGETQRAIARSYGVSRGCIHAIVRRKAWLTAEDVVEHQAFQSGPSSPEQANSHAHVGGESFQLRHAASVSPFPSTEKRTTHERKSIDGGQP